MLFFGWPLHSCWMLLMVISVCSCIDLGSSSTGMTRFIQLLGHSLRACLALFENKLIFSLRAHEISAKDSFEVMTEWN